MISHTTESDDSHGLLIVRVKGIAETQETREMGYKVRSQAKLTGKKLILDFSQTDLFKITLLDLDLWFKEYYDRLDRELREVPTAILADPKYKLLLKFIKISWQDQGVLTMPCKNQANAIAWLEDQNYK